MRAVPVGPLLDRAACGAGVPTADLSSRALAEMLGVQPDTIRRWLRTGLVPTSKVDRAAIALGWHPDAIWGPGWDSED